MRVLSLELDSFRSFIRLDRMELGDITVLIGPNNAGKSSILRALYTMQLGAPEIFADVRAGSTRAVVKIELSDISSGLLVSNGIGNPESLSHGVLQVELKSQDRRSGDRRLQLFRDDGAVGSVKEMPDTDPNHFIVPYTARRKTTAYDENAGEQRALQVIPSMSFLAAKLSRLNAQTFPGHDHYVRACKDILGFVVTAVPSSNGLRPGAYLPNREPIYIDQMGEGVPNIVGLLADLAMSEGKLFLVEEPENDLHPKALKAMLDLVAESSKSNQFVVSTHSNIVLRHLGSVAASRMYVVNGTQERWPPEASVQAVAPTPEARISVLRDLGYSLSDFELWDGWLVLEESSAERIIRDYLIPWFAPRLARLRTLSTGGTGGVEPTFEDFRRLMLFAHLEQIYRNATWVRLDADDSGTRVVERLKEKYPSWEDDRFACFSQPQFERYYPSYFSAKVAEVLAIRDERRRKDAKRDLLDLVRRWLDEDGERGRTALSESASTVIADLRSIELKLAS
jgi:hypothetical protein